MSQRAAATTKILHNVLSLFNMRARRVTRESSSVFQRFNLKGKSAASARKKKLLIRTEWDFFVLKWQQIHSHHSTYTLHAVMCTVEADKVYVQCSLSLLCVHVAITGWGWEIKINWTRFIQWINWIFQHWFAFWIFQHANARLCVLMRKVKFH